MDDNEGFALASLWQVGSQRRVVFGLLLAQPWPLRDQEHVMGLVPWIALSGSCIQKAK